MNGPGLHLDLADLKDAEAPADRVGRALLAAQYAADETLAEARAEAQHILARARADAEHVRSTAQAEVAHLDQLVAGLRQQIATLSDNVAEATRLRAAAASVAMAAPPVAIAEPVPPASPVGAVQPVESAAPVEQQAAETAPTEAATRAPELRHWWSAVPLEALLPILVIVVALLVMLALMG